MDESIANENITHKGRRIHSTTTTTTAAKICTVSQFRFRQVDRQGYYTPPWHTQSFLHKPLCVCAYRKRKKDLFKFGIDGDEMQTTWRRLAREGHRHLFFYPDEKTHPDENETKQEAWTEKYTHTQCVYVCALDLV